MNLPNIGYRSHWPFVYTRFLGIDHLSFQAPRKYFRLITTPKHEKVFIFLPTILLRQLEWIFLILFYILFLLLNGLMFKISADLLSISVTAKSVLLHKVGVLILNTVFIPLR